MPPKPVHRHAWDLTPADARALQTELARRPTAFPYVPGLLSFREIPAVLDALAALEASPQLLVCDGQGFAHPRRFGLACHLGWPLDMPCIGVAKSRLTGSFAEPPQRRGAWTPLIDRDETIGAALSSRVTLAMACTRAYRLPETTRHAHRLASAPSGAVP